MGSIPRLLACLLCVLLVATSADADYNCSIYGDPHLRMYKEARGTILLPCSLRATHFLMKIAGQEKLCEINIHTFGRVHGGGVYIGGVEININIIQPQGNLLYIISSATLFVSDYFIQSGNTNFTWGSVPSITLDVALLTWSFNNASAILDVPACEFSLRYTLRSVRPSGFWINVSPNAVISPGYKDYVFCGDLNDTPRTLIDDARSLQLDTVEQVLAYRMLEESQTDNFFNPSLTPRFDPNAAGCVTVKFYFQTVCSETARLQALKSCLGIFSKRRLLKCLYGQGETHPLTVFQRCIEAACSGGSVDTCDRFREVIQPCKARLTPRLLQMYNSPTCNPNQVG